MYATPTTRGARSSRPSWLSSRPCRVRATRDRGAAETLRTVLHDLFDEYRYLHAYPPRELEITGALFGMLVQRRVIPDGRPWASRCDILNACDRERAPPPPGEEEQETRRCKCSGALESALRQFLERLLGGRTLRAPADKACGREPELAEEVRRRLLAAMQQEKHKRGERDERGHERNIIALVASLREAERETMNVDSNSSSNSNR